MVVTWLLTLGFQDQLPNSPLSQREWLPGVQKIERKIEKNLEKMLEMAKRPHPAGPSTPRNVAGWEEKPAGSVAAT